MRASSSCLVKASLLDPQAQADFKLPVNLKIVALRSSFKLCVLRLEHRDALWNDGARDETVRERDFRCGPPVVEIPTNCSVGNFELRCFPTCTHTTTGSHGIYGTTFGTVAVRGRLLSGHQ
jgi:hypothetical protein